MAKYLVIVPARGGSKGIRLKNLLEIDGLSLIGYAIKAALETNLDVDVVLSSENELMLKEGLKYGARTHKRAHELASDSATTISVVADVLSTVNYTPELVLVLQPTSPFRTKEDIIGAIALVETLDGDSLISVCETPNDILKTFCINSDGYAEGVYTNDAPFSPRQLLPKVYKANGSIFITKPAVIKSRNRLYGDSLVPFIMAKKNSIDIDSVEDLMGLSYKLYTE
jgi:N-acylneuraminate cytidylyltransferase